MPYLTKALSGLSGGYVSLDASRPWLIYWILHALDLMDSLPPPAVLARAVDTLTRCQCPTGGFAGGPAQLPHCAPTYAACLSLLLIGSPEAFGAINRPALYRFFMSMKDPSGGFTMHDNGEIDIRGTYTVVAIAKVLQLLLKHPCYLLYCSSTYTVQPSDLTVAIAKVR